MTLILITAITLALVSMRIEQTGPELIEYGNLCGAAGNSPCYEPALKGGFPIAYLVDAPGISVQRKLSFGEDNLHAAALVANIAVYFAILMAILWAVKRRKPVADPDAK